MSKTLRLRACIKLVDALLGSELEPEQRCFVLFCRKRLIELSQRRNSCREETLAAVNEISTLILQAFHRHKITPRV